MADDMDRLVERDAEWIEQSNLNISKNMDRPGRKCNTPGCTVVDDRIHAGYAKCSSCMDEIYGEAK